MLLFVFQWLCMSWVSIAEPCEAQKYLPWQEVRPERPPSQLVAFNQLKFRFEHRKPIATCIFGPAGFGKTEISAAWLCYVKLHGAFWQSSAPTGVAATQIAGSTLHNLTMMSLDGVSTLSQDVERLKSWCETSGLLLDESFMISCETGDQLLQVCQEYPLRADLRAKFGAPTMRCTGYRHLLVFGDIRQLPPASGSRPWWSTKLFLDMFEIFVLREDRRHEKDADMRRLKELLAWGGSEPNKNKLCADEVRSVDPQAAEFVLEGYLRGVGLTGENVDLEVGTAFFPRRMDVKHWNAGCVRQIEKKYNDEVEALDVIGYDWKASKAGKPQSTQTRRLQGIQSPQVLQLRTCQSHRQRVMLLQNQNPKAGWANGTRARLLSSKSWAGKQQPVVLDPTSVGTEKKYVADTLELEGNDHIDFQVHVVKDEKLTINKTFRFDSLDVQSITGKNEEGSGKWRSAWHQIQLVLAYALTVHKCQGLTETRGYPALTMTFGFGLPYTMCTRTPWQHNVCNA